MLFFRITWASYPLEYWTNHSQSCFLFNRKSATDQGIASKTSLFKNSRILQNNKKFLIQIPFHHSEQNSHLMCQQRVFLKLVFSSNTAWKQQLDQTHQTLERYYISMFTKRSHRLHAKMPNDSTSVPFPYEVLSKGCWVTRWREENNRKTINVIQVETLKKNVGKTVLINEFKDCLN